MSTTQPIALPNSQPNFQDYTMAEGSYTGSSGSFNPASYARHFLGSPISWRQGSFGSRIHSGSPSAQFFSSIDCNDLKYSKVSSSIESDRGSILNALNVFDREGELCRNYTCCGLHLNDMHALVEHLEEVHFGAYHSNPPHTQTQVQAPYNTQPIQPDYSIATPAQVPTHNHTSVATSHLPTGPSYPTSFDSDDMEFELELETSAPAPQAQSSAHSSPSSNATTPPDTPITTPLSAYPAHTFPNAHLTLPQSNIHSPYASQPASPLASHDSSAYASAASTAASTRHPSPTGTSSSRPNLNLNLSAFQRSNQYNTSSPSILTNPEEAFNPYARFSSDYSSCMPGAQYNPADVNEASALHANWPQHQGGAANAGQCVPPALLFSSSASTTPISTPDGSRVPSPTTSGYGGSRSLSQCSAPTTPSRTSPPSCIGNSASGRSSSSRSAAASTLSRPASSLLLSKPFRCPKPNCNKSYKQANGLKYHITHGSCNFAPPKDLEHVKDLLERKRRDREREREKLGEAGGDSSSGPLGRSMSLGNIGEPYDDSQDLSSIMSNISEAELREVEREAEKRMKPFACGVGDCQRRYKNMNGLRYHYQHSGDHGAVGLALLASGQHECLQGQKRGQHHQSATSGTQGPDGDKDGRRRSIQSPSRGSASMPVSRATSRTGTPQPLPQQPPNQQVPAQHYSPMNANVSVPGGINALGMTQAQPFTPPQANASQAATAQQLQSHQVDTQTQQQIFHHQYAQLHQQHYQQYAHAMAAQQQQQSPQQQHMMQGLYSNSIEMS